MLIDCHDGCDGDFTPGNEITFERMGGKDDNGDESNAHAIRAIDPHGNQAGWIWRDLAVTLSPLMMNRKFDNVRMVGRVRMVPQDNPWEIPGHIAFFGLPTR